MVLLLGLEMATRSRRPVRQGRRERPRLQYVISFFSGMCSALFGINMFLVAYLQRTARDYDEFKGSICFLFLGEGLFRTILYACSGLLDGTAVWFGLISLASVLVSLCVARPLSRHVQGSTLQQLAVGFFILSGISIIVKSLMLHA